jgi:glucokinase
MKTNNNNKYTMGIDVGGTKIAFALMDQQGQIHNKILLTTNASEGYPAIEKKILEGIYSLDSDLSHTSAIGIGLAGQIDSYGTVSLAPNLNWQNIPLQKNLESHLKVPITIMNDVRAATFGEWQVGAGKGYKDLVCLFIGTGIGGGIVSNGQLLTGSTECCGELGHMIIDWRGPHCTCGSFGCFEAMAGGWAIAKQAQELSFQSPDEWKTVLSQVEQRRNLITAKAVIEASLMGERGPLMLMQRVEEALIAGCISIVNTLNPHRLILGGGIIHGAPHLVTSIQNGVKARALPAAKKHLEVVCAELGDQAGVIGAALFAEMRARP